MVTEGDPAPDLTFEDIDGKPARLSDYRGRAVLLFFYPKDDTGGCTREALDFSALAPEFAAAGVALLGISKDSPKKHRAFIAKHGLAVALASDPEGALIDAFGSWIEKSLYGRKYMGIDRSTFLIDPSGRIVRAWRKVRVPGHATAVLAAVRGDN